MIMERLVRWLAPTGPVSFAAKFCLLAIAVGGMNHMRDVLENGSDAGPLLRNVTRALIVGAPFLILGLSMVGHLNRLQMKMYEMAHTDVLTQLPNRLSFMKSLGALIAEGKANGLVVLIDADHFKQINDNYGHPTGDEALRALGQLMHDLQEPEDIAGRLGGEEFGLLMARSDTARLRVLADKLANGIVIHPEPAPEPLRVTLSAGAVLLGSGDNMSGLLRRADAALYQAKAEGRARLILAKDDNERAVFAPAEKAAS